MPFDPTDPRYASPLAAMAQDRMSGMLNQPQMKVFADAPQNQGTTSGSPILPGQMQLNRTMGMALGGPVNDELAGIKDTIRAEFAKRGLDFDRFVSNPAVMDEVGKSIQSQGQNGDTILAHINPKEAQTLKRMGGSGTINPHTGLPQFAEDSSSSNQSPSYSGSSGSNYGNYMGGSDIGGYSGSGNTQYNPSTGGTTTSPTMGGTIGGGGGGGGGAAIIGGRSNTVSPTGSGGPSVNLGEGQQGAAQTIGSQPAFAGVDPMSGLPIGGASNISGLGYVATAPSLAPGLGTFAPTESGIGTVPVSGSDTGLSNIAFGDTANMPAMGATEAAGAIGNVSPGVADYDPVSRNFIDVNGNRFTVDSAGRRQYTSFSTSLPNSPVVTSPGVQSEILPTLQGSKILPSGLFSTSGPAVMQPAASMIAKEQGQAPSEIQQAAIESPSTSDLIAALDSNNPAAQMDAAMQIVGGGANMFGLTGDIFTTAQTNLSDAAILDRRLAGMEKIGGMPQLGAADMTGTLTPQATSLADLMGTTPQGNYLFSSATPGTPLGPEQYALNLNKAYNQWLEAPSENILESGLKLASTPEKFNLSIPDILASKPYGQDVKYNPEANVFTVTNPESAEIATLKKDPALADYLTDITKRTAPITNWGEPGAGEAPFVSSDVAPKTFADITPLSEPAPLSIASTGLTIPSPAPAVASTGITFPSIVNSANATTPDLFSPTTETTFQMPGTVPLPPTRPEETPLFTGNIPVPTPRPANFDAAIAKAPPAVKAAVGTSTNPPANTETPQTDYDRQVAALENADMIANGMSKEEYAKLMGVPVSEVKTRITSAFGPPMAEYYTKTLFEAFAGMTGGKTNTEGAMNLMSMLSPLGILGLAAKAGYNQYQKSKKPIKKAEGGFVSNAPYAELPTPQIQVPYAVTPVQQSPLNNIAPQIAVPQINLQKFATPYTGVSPDYKPPVAPPPATPTPAPTQDPKDWLKSKFSNFRDIPRGYSAWQDWFKSNLTNAPKNIQDWYGTLPTAKKDFMKSILPIMPDRFGFGDNRDGKNKSNYVAPVFTPRVRTPMPQEYGGYGGEYSYYNQGGVVSPLKTMGKK